MGFFSGLPANSEPATIKAAFSALLRDVHARRKQSLKCSLGELSTDEEDFDWLHAWACQLSAATAHTFLRPDLPDNGAGEHLKPRLAIGSLFLLWAAESARRALPVESEWLLPAASSFPQHTRPLLFTNGVPTPAYLSALRQAARGLGLRDCTTNGDAGFLTDAQPSQRFPHLFNNFLLVQVGLTSANIGKRLSMWVTSNDIPLPISSLLDEQHGSRSFQNLWYAMQAYQQLEISEEWLRQTLEQSTWILPQWVEPILKTFQPQGRPSIPASAPLPIPPASADEPETLPAAPPHDLFGAFYPFGGIKTVTKALRALCARIEQLQLGNAPWSLAELRLSDYDYLWLRVWVRQVEPFTIQYCQERKTTLHAGTQKVTFQAGLGLLLLLWLSETARRIAVEGELWPYVVADHFKPEAGEELFTQGQSSYTLRELLRAAVHRFKLRQVLAEQGVQRWLDTVFLQFGFTARGSRQRLPEWLAGQATTRAVSSLLDQHNGSRSFQQLWESLRAYRKNQIGEPTLRSTLTESPWILPEWVENLVRLAKDSVGWVSLKPEEETSPDTFLTPPVLHWPDNNDPQFLCQIVTDLNHLGLSESSYDVRIGGTIKAQLLRQGDGSYLPVPSRVIALDFNDPQLAASLVNEKGETVKEQDLELWPVNDDVVAYRFPGGERVRDVFEDTLSNTASYGLLIASDLQIEPQPADWKHAASGSAVLYRLPKVWPTETQVWLEGEVLWQPNVKLKTTVPAWAINTDIFLADTKSVKWGKPFQARVRHHPEVTVRYVRCQSRAIDTTKLDPTTTQVGPLMIATDLNARSLEFRLGLENGVHRCTVRRKLDLNLIGAAHLRNGDWEVLNKHSVLTVEEAKRDLFKISLPGKWGSKLLNASEISMMEGDGISHKRPALGPGPLGTVTGWGAPLTLRHLFNATPNTIYLKLAGSVVNHGILAGAVCESLRDGRAPLVRLCFRQPIEPTQHHRVVWWDVDGRLLSLSPKYWDEAEGVWWWVCELPEEGLRPLAVAATYKGERHGAWWEGRNWLFPLAQQAEKNALRTAALLRWFHLPLLSPDALPVLRPLAEQYPDQFLRAWLLSEGLPDELIFVRKDEAWLSVVRTLLRDWQPDAEQAQQVLLALAEVEMDEDLPEALWDAINRLNNVDPLLMARVIKAWQNPKKADWLKKIKLQIAGCHAVALLPKYQQLLLDKAVKNLGLNPGLINTGILGRAVDSFKGKAIDLTAQNNLAIAARIEDLRRLLALRLLENV